MLAFIRTGAVAAPLMLILGLAHAQQPNILLIVADDVGYSDLGAYGGEIRTPTLDRLARTGLQFTNFHAAATCGPTRAMLMSGLHPHEVGLGSFGSRLAGAPELHGLPGYRGSMDEDVPLVSELIDAAGYDTYMVGKWHIGDGANNPDARGFDRSFSLMDGGASHYADATGVYLGTATYTQNGQRIARMEELGLLAAEHTRYDSPSIPAWDELSDLAKRVEARRMEVYAAMVENMDYHIGRLLDRLYKRFPTEGGLRVPAFIHHGAFARQGARNDELVTAMDLAMTMAELAGIDLALDTAVRNMRGQSLLPYLEGARRDALGGERTTGKNAILAAAFH